MPTRTLEAQSRRQIPRPDRRQAPTAGDSLVASRNPPPYGIGLVDGQREVEGQCQPVAATTNDAAVNLIRQAATATKGTVYVDLRNTCTRDLSVMSAEGIAISVGSVPALEVVSFTESELVYPKPETPTGPGCPLETKPTLTGLMDIAGAVVEKPTRITVRREVQLHGGATATGLTVSAKDGTSRDVVVTTAFPLCLAEDTVLAFGGSGPSSARKIVGKAWLQVGRGVDALRRLTGKTVLGYEDYMAAYEDWSRSVEETYRRSGGSASFKTSPEDFERKTNIVPESSVEDAVRRSLAIGSAADVRG